MHSIVTARDISFEVANERILFNKINFTLDSKLTALVGPNGVGKTCLAKLICGEYEPSHGSIRRLAQVNFFPQREVAPSISVNEYLIENFEWSLLKDKLLKGIDREGREAVIQFLKESDSGVLLISHDRECLQLCENVLELSNKGLSKHGDGWASYEEQKNLMEKTLEDNLDLATRDRDKALIHRNEKKAQQEKRNRRGAKLALRGGIPKIILGGMKRQAQVTTAKIDVTSLEKANEAVSEAYLAFQELKSAPMMYAEISGAEIPKQKLILEAENFNLRFSHWVFKENIKISCRGNIRLSIKGNNGSGKSTLLKYFMNQIEAETQGKFHRGKLNTLYVDQRCEFLDDHKSILENIRDSSLLDESEIRNQLAKFLFTKESVFQKANSLSGGERLRACLAKGLLSSEKPELLILDEPTNNLDLQNIKFIEALIREFKGALIVISHDEVFLENCNIIETLNLKRNS